MKKLSRQTADTSPNFIRMTKSRRMGWAGHVTRVEEIINAYKTVVGKPEGKITWKT
jgi:hypothetical protein